MVKPEKIHRIELVAKRYDAMPPTLVFNESYDLPASGVLDINDIYRSDWDVKLESFTERYMKVLEIVDDPAKASAIIDALEGIDS